MISLNPLWTLHNCFIFGSVTKNMFDASMSQLHFFDEGREATINNIVERFSSCLKSYCKQIPNCIGEASPSPLLYSYNPGSKGLVAGGQDLVWNICSNIPARITSDVGGIGVCSPHSVYQEPSLTLKRAYASYWIQTGLSISGFIGTVLWKWLVPNIYFGLVALYHGPQEARVRSQRVNQSVQRHLASLITALTDFQKAQCFFMLATNTAALVIIQRGGLDPQSLQQIYNSWIFLKVITVNGFLPTTFTLANLHLVGMLSWYLILLSGLTIALSTATLAAVGTFNPSEREMHDLATFAASGGLLECDGIQPGVYCYAPMTSYQSPTNGHDHHQDLSSIENAPHQILTFCLVVMALLVGYRFGILSKISRWYGHLVRYAFPRVAPSMQKTDLKDWATAAVRMVLYVTFLVFYIQFFNLFLHDLAWFAQNNVYNVNWNFGQVCAITVWALPICEYIHLKVRGMQRGFDHRLMSPFRVTQNSDVETAAATGKVSVPDHDDEDLRRCEGSAVD